MRQPAQRLALRHAELLLSCSVHTAMCSKQAWPPTPPTPPIWSACCTVQYDFRIVLTEDFYCLHGKYLCNDMLSFQNAAFICFISWEIPDKLLIYRGISSECALIKIQAIKINWINVCKLNKRDITIQCEVSILMYLAKLNCLIFWVGRGWGVYGKILLLLFVFWIF